jgi:phosphatidate cytidylyltransferase
MAEAAKLPPSNLTQRILTGIVVTPFVVLAVIAGGLAFALLVTAFAVIGVVEFYILARNRPSQGSVLIGVPTLVVVILAFYMGEPLLWVTALIVSSAVTFILETLRHHKDVRRSIFQVGMTLAGVLYIGFPSGFLVSLRLQPDGVLWILLILVLTWGTDSFAYIGGRLWGKTKLAPAISPKKTLEGAVVGIIGGIIPALILLAAADRVQLSTLVVVVIAPFLAILGDLVESGLKRFFQVKDSHVAGLNILPGHGGILDRIDGLLLVTVFTYIWFLLTGLR